MTRDHFIQWLIGHIIDEFSSGRHSIVATAHRVDSRTLAIVVDPGQTFLLEVDELEERPDPIIQLLRKG